MKILVIEDEKKLAYTIVESLKNEKFDVCLKYDGESGEDEALTNTYDLIILDVMLPKKNGFEILKTLKKEKIKAPIIIVTAKDTIQDKLNGFEIGADDYVTKPFHIRELLARVKVSIKSNNNIEDINIFQFGNLRLDMNSGILSCNEKSIQISGKELNLMEFFMINKNKAVERETLANKIWGFDSDTNYNNVEVYISFLRKKLKLLKTSVEIETIKGLGYKLEVKK